MKKMFTTTGVCLTLMIFLLGALSSGSAMAESESDYLFSAVSNSIWVLKKSTRNLMFLQFQDPEKTWKSNIVVVPPDFNLNQSVLTSVGSRGTSVFLHDKSSGLITLFNVKKDRSVVSYAVVNINEDLK